jgi:cysteinyl-tRNA synthetase
MDDDFNTPEALATVFTLATEANAAIDAGNVDDAAPLVAAVRELAGVLGIDVGVEEAVSDDERQEIDARVHARNEARANKDWAAADAIRDELKARGIELEDTPNGTVWRRASE